MNNEKGIKQNYKVFFIISNLSELDNTIKYYLSKDNHGIINFNNVWKKTIKYNNNQNFIVKVYYFEIVQKELNKNDIDEISKKYKAKINVKYNKNKFNGIILFKEGKNNFIYDFYFSENKVRTSTCSPPKYIHFSKLEQFKIFNEVLKYFKVKQLDDTMKDFIVDSKRNISSTKKFYFDYYLEIFKFCYSLIEVQSLLEKFKLDNILLPKEMEIKNYCSFLSIIEEKPDILISHCSEEENKEKYFKSFYNILLYFRANYEKEKVQDLLRNKELIKYFIEILPSNYKYYSNLDIPDELIFEMLNQDKLEFNKIKDILSFGSSIEKILYIINKKIDIIANCCIKENKVIDMSEIGMQKKTDDLNRIIKGIEKINNYQVNEKKSFFKLGDKFWEYYYDIQYENRNLKNLILIRRTIIKINQYVNYDLKEKIHKIGLTGGIKSEEELIDFLENEEELSKVYKKYKTEEQKLLLKICGNYLKKLLNENNEFKTNKKLIHSNSQSIINKYNNLLNYKVGHIYSFTLYNNDIQNNMNSILNEELIKLKNELTYKSKIIEKQKLLIIDLEKKINILNVINNNINQSLSEFTDLENNINIKQQLILLNNELKNINEELIKYKNNNIFVGNKNEETININFMLFNEELIYPIVCKNNDIPEKIEKQIYNEYPEYSNYKTYLSINGKIINKNKTIKENGIKNGNIIIINISEN